MSKQTATKATEAKTCPKCNATQTHKAGIIFYAGGRVQARRCTACGYRGREAQFITKEQL